MSKLHCQNCGNEKTFIQTTNYSGSGTIYLNADGQWCEEGENSDLYSGARHRDGKIIRCALCNKKVAKAVDRKEK